MNVRRQTNILLLKDSRLHMVAGPFLTSVNESAASRPYLVSVKP